MTSLPFRNVRRDNRGRCRTAHPNGNFHFVQLQQDYSTQFSSKTSIEGTMARQISSTAVTLSLLFAKHPPVEAFMTPPRVMASFGVPTILHDETPWISHRFSGTSSLQARITNLNQDFLEEDDDEEEEEEEEDVYREMASSEFNGDSSTTSMDWGSALGSLRQRVGDIEGGTSQNPSNVLFRLMTSESPNIAIGSFVREANPEILSAMSGAVSGLLGGLSNPTTGIDTVVKANGEKVASLCFQLQMTGYMFRNAEYVVALKDLMKIQRGASIDDFQAAFDRIDTDGSGYIEAAEIDGLLADVYDGSAPAFEVRTFLRFFDSNRDGKISWPEFERGLGAMNTTAATARKSLPPGFGHDEDEEEEDANSLGEPEVSGTIEVEMEDGKLIQVEAKDYIEGLKQEAQALKDAIARERGDLPSSSSPEDNNQDISPGSILSGPDSNSQSQSGGVTALIASLGGDLRQLTEGISPEIVDTMKSLVDFVLEGGDKKKTIDLQKDMELPGSALQQLALWQLVLGYRLREAEATGDYKRLLDN